MNNDEILKVLKEKYNCQSARLPRDIDFQLEQRKLYITIKRPDANMQSNEAAFEAWTLAIKAAFKDSIEEVILFVDPEFQCETQNYHYNRFLWRANNFREIFDWFSIGSNLEENVDRFMLEKFHDVRINQPSEERKPVINSEGERFIEYLFASKYKAALRGKLHYDDIKNQIPVGLFTGKVSKNNAIFSGGGSAIDLLGYKAPDTLHLIELKKGDKYGLGIISEFLFYAFVLYNLCVRNPPVINFDGEIKVASYKFLKDHKYKEIKGYLLVEKSHPLLDNDVLKLLSQGLSRFNMDINRIVYEYDEATQMIVFK